MWPGGGPTNDISTELKIRPKFAVLWFKIFSTDHKEILHTSRQLHSWRVQNFLWLVTYILN